MNELAWVTQSQVADLGLIKSATLTLTDDQIKALPTTPIELISAPGALKVLVPLYVHMRMSGADYTNIDATASISIKTGAALASLNEGVNSSVSGLLAGGDPADASHALITLEQRQLSTTLTVGISGFYDSDIVNKPMTLTCSNASAGDFTDGDPGNTLKVIVYYTVVDVS